MGGCCVVIMIVFFHQLNFTKSTKSKTRTSGVCWQATLPQFCLFLALVMDIMTPFAIVTGRGFTVVVFAKLRFEI